MQENINLSVDVVKINSEDIRLEGAQTVSLEQGAVKGASSVAAGFHPLFLWGAVVIFFLIALNLYFLEYQKKKR